jgi:hypothetical protein
MVQKFFSIVAFVVAGTLLSVPVNAQTPDLQETPRSEGARTPFDPAPTPQPPSAPRVGEQPREGSAGAQAPYVPFAPEPFGGKLAPVQKHVGWVPREKTPLPPTTITPVIMQHNDLSRTGQYLTETTLTPSNVNSTQFGKVFSYPVDGQMFTQPLYVPDVTINGTSHNVVYVATENDSVYAFDADGLSSTPLWQVNYLDSTSSLSVTPVPCGTDGSTTDISCNVFPYYGITGTPGISLATQNPATGTMYFVVRTQETPTGGLPNYYQRLHAVDITTGKDVSGSPVVVSGTFAGIGAGSDGTTVTYDPLGDIQRSAITLANGNVYIGWAGAAHGWLMAYNATTLKQVAVFNTAPNFVLGGIWQTGNGFVVDASGDLYLAVGDAMFDASLGGTYADDYGDTVLKMSPTLDILDYFTPMDQLCRAPNDLDVGSAGPILLPTQGGKYPNELLVLAKSGYGVTGDTCDTSDVYLLNLDHLGGYDTGTGGTDNVLEEFTDPPIVGTNNIQPQGFWSSGAFWQGTESANGQTGTSYAYMAGTSALDDFNGGAPLDQYSINGVTGSTQTAQLTNLVQSSNLFPQGATPSISSNGSTDGIVWAIERIDSLDAQPGDTAAVLYAYDATNVATMLYNSAQAANGRDQGGCANKFQVPTIANGRVYVATQTQLDVYGLLPASPPAEPWVYLPTVCYTWGNAVNIGSKSPPQALTIQNTGSAALKISSIKMTGLNGPDFRLTNKCGISLAAGKSCEISVTFAPTTGLPEIAYVSIANNAVGSPHNIRVIGTGNGPSVVVNPGYLAFGRQDIGIASAVQTITVANSGSLPVDVSGVTITGTNSNLFSQSNDCSTIQVNENCTISVTFTPQVTGQFSASLNVEDNAGGPQQVSLTGVGVQPNAVISPNQISFGQVKVGSSSTPQPITLTNNGNGTLLISSITFSGPNPGDFSQTNTCKGSVASQSSCTINVTFKPTTQGTREAFINVNDNSSPSPQTVSLNGDGT